LHEESSKPVELSHNRSKKRSTQVGRVDVERQADEDEVGETRAEPREEATRVDIERQADEDRVGETRAEPREEAAKIDKERRADVDGVDERRS
jgi:hypothetical protein